MLPLRLVVVFIVISGLVGIGLGYFIRWLLALGKRGSIDLEIKKMMLEAREEAEKITTEAEQASKKMLEESRKEVKSKEQEQKRTEERLVRKEELLDSRQQDLEQEVELIKERVQEIKDIRAAAEEKLAQRTAALEAVAKLTKEEAKEEIFKTVEQESQNDILERIHKLEAEGQERYERKAQEILVTTIQRIGSSVVSDAVITNVAIPNDDTKGKIIGKEGRNIKAFERATGVEVLVDDTPGSVVLSCFDPVRRQVARVALEELIKDGRIQPARIEDTVEKAKKSVNAIIKEKGENAAYECGLLNLDPRLIAILGRLAFRTSYGQNVLQHSIEVSHIAGMLAEEVGADIATAKAGGLVHDIGKAVDHDTPGTHVEIGIRILEKFGVGKKVIDAMKSHHDEYPYESLEAYIVQTADAISAARPGARRDSIEMYLKRLADLEAIANKIPGVEKSYAIQAGHEIRIFVNPESVSDVEAYKLAQNVAREIERELKYPGEIKVSVIRETRVIEYAK